MTDMISEFEGTGPNYTPTAIYYADSDCVEYVAADCFCLYERVDEFLTLVMDSSGANLIGFKLKGFRNLIQHRLRESIKISDDEFLMLVEALQKILTDLGDDVIDDSRLSAYKWAYKLAANDNVRLEFTPEDKEYLLDIAA